MAPKMARLVFSLLLSVPSAGIASVPAFTLSGGAVAQDLYNPPFTLGYEFYAYTSTTVDALGLYDSSGDGLADSHAVGLWNASGVLLSSTVVSSGTSDALVNGFRYADVTPLTLTAGNYYTIGALYTQGDEPLIFTGDDISAVPAVAYVGTTFASGSTLQSPTNFASYGGFFGPNFEVVAATPEPAAWATIGIGAALALLMAGRKRGRKVVFATA
jgi:hypothetical protein